ncbi:MAG: guanylate kinase [Acidimicrobiia bacterium]|nr:guanylate kinase [Acidimicrobiia bacterium]
MTEHIFVISGPGGAGKGTLVDKLMARDPHLWLSRSWTTREQRPGERDNAYTFVDRDTFFARRDAGGFLEWVELLPGYFMGTPLPDPPPRKDLVLEIDVRGARQVREKYPDAVVILVLPPSAEELGRRMRKRGDDEGLIQARLALGETEEAEGRKLADHVLVNDDLDRAVEELAGIVSAHRSQES